MKRILSIDITRGVAMIIMALDHVRDMIHVDSIAQSPTDLATTTPILFFTRWITYLCAPTFVFLAGTSAYLSIQRSQNTSKSRNFLIKRGLYLIVLDLTVVNLGLFFDYGFHTILFEVVAAIGFGFIMLAIFLKTNPRTLGILGLIILFGHNLFSMIQFEQGSLLKAIISPFITFNAFPFFSNHVFIIAYPPLPWLGVMLTGVWAAQIFELSEAKRKVIFFKLGISAILLFILFRLINVYSNPIPWSLQKNWILTFLSFLNVTKYPPSLAFCLVTLGIMLLFFAYVEGKTGKLANIASIYGKVPLFYFLVHFFLIHFLLVIILFFQGFNWAQLDFASSNFGRPKSLTSGLALWQIYLIWIGVVAILYKPCRWYGAYKMTHQYWWLKYL